MLEISINISFFHMNALSILGVAVVTLGVYYYAVTEKTTNRDEDCESSRCAFLEEVNQTLAICKHRDFPVHIRTAIKRIERNGSLVELGDADETISYVKQVLETKGYPVLIMKDTDKLDDSIYCMIIFHKRERNRVRFMPDPLNLKAERVALEEMYIPYFAQQKLRCTHIPIRGNKQHLPCTSITYNVMNHTCVIVNSFGETIISGSEFLEV